jgi:hypothetical protein
MKNINRILKTPLMISRLGMFLFYFIINNFAITNHSFRNIKSANWWKSDSLNRKCQLTFTLFRLLWKNDLLTQTMLPSI